MLRWSCVSLVVGSMIASACGSETFIDAPVDAGPDGGALGGIEGDAAAGGDALLECPEGMVRTSLVCIDAREVSVALYAEFLGASSGVPQIFPSGCASKAAFLPDEFEAQLAFPSRPVRLVDWCDAVAYCDFHRKRLCTQAEWTEACTKGGTGAPSAGCVLDDTDVDFPLDVDRSGSSCHGAYEGLFDMVGNVEEWVDDCGGTSCRVMGSSFEREGRCSSVREDNATQRRETIGVRCCKPL